MTLTELLVAGMIAGSRCCASLQVFSQAAAASHVARTRLEAGELLELHWLASRRWLMAANASCSDDPMALAQKLMADLPLDDSLQRSLIDDDASWGLWLVLNHPATGLQRRQLFTAAGSGWCNDTAATTSEAEA